MRLLATAAAALLLLAGAAQAQTPLTGTTGPLTSPPPSATPAAGTEATAPASGGAATVRHRRTLEERFEAANTTHDGHLTLEQARSKMPSVARDFAAIDTDHRGYVTVDQIRDHAKQARAAKREAHRAAKTQ